MRELVAAQFSGVLARRYGSGHSCEFNQKLGRYVVITPSSVGRPVPQVVAWRVDPRTGERTTPDALGLLPFRELDATCQQEILDAMDATALTNRHDGAQRWSEQVRRADVHNEAVTNQSIREAAELFAMGITEVDLRRPWLKHHSGPQSHRRIAMGIR